MMMCSMENTALLGRLEFDEHCSGLVLHWFSVKIGRSLALPDLAADQIVGSFPDVLALQLSVLSLGAIRCSFPDYRCSDWSTASFSALKMSPLVANYC